MYGTLILVDLVLAVLTPISAAIAGNRPVRRWLGVLGVLAAARLAIALQLLAGGMLLADSRLIVQAPLAVLPVAWAIWKPSPTSAHVAAAGSVLSVWWLLMPTGPPDWTLVLAGSVAALGMIAGLSVAVRRWRAGGSRLARMPWLTAALLLVPAISLGVASAAGVVKHTHSGSGRLSVAQLTGPRAATPDVRLTLTAARGTVRLASGRTVATLTFNGSSPGPEIRVKAGELVEVTLVNRDVAEGVTIHWHGVDVPNAEDGVPGVTQDTVPPGGRHIYRYVPTRTGTYWYHTHRDGALNVQKGLYGALIVEEPAEGQEVERTVFTHAWPGQGRGILAFDRADRPEEQDVQPGRPVRVRLINSSERPQTVYVGGVAFRVSAIDGNAVRGATPLESGTGLQLAAGGRYDVAFTMPAGAVSLGIADQPDAKLTFRNGAAEVPVASAEGKMFDPLTYGSATVGTAAGTYQRTYDLRLDDGFGISASGLSYVTSLINGRLYPAVPSIEVDRGDRVRMRIANRGISDHPFHLHGHRVRVLSRNGVPASGSPWWTDTLNIAGGELFEVEFIADNPGIWMNHCHNFRHSANGIIMHVAYRGVDASYSSEHPPE